MSYDVELIENGSPVKVDLFNEGSILVVGGNAEAEINITYNYGLHFYEVDNLRGLRWLDGKSGRETIERLEQAVAALGTERYRGPYYVLKMEYIGSRDEKIKRFHGVDFEDPANAHLLAEARELEVVYNTGGYWKSTPGNAGYMLNILLRWARQHPNAVWNVS